MRPVEHQQVSTNGVRLHVAQAGPKDGSLVLLLHGFPEFWYGWRKQLPFLAEAGFRVWALDGRGYNLSEKPKGVPAYRLDTLAEDVLGCIDVAGRARATLIGHDWGGVVAWWVASLYPERLERLVILNAPHPAVMRRALRHPAQLRRSWYVLFFQLPWLPEACLRARNWRLSEDALRRTSRPGTFPEAVLRAYRRAWAQPGALSATLNWYRAALRGPHASQPRVRVPTLIIWGTEDRFLGRELARSSLEVCDDGQLVLLDATHWVQHEEAERVNGLMEAFLRGRR